MRAEKRVKEKMEFRQRGEPNDPIKWEFRSIKGGARRKGRMTPIYPLPTKNPIRALFLHRSSKFLGPMVSQKVEKTVIARN